MKVPRSHSVIIGSLFLLAMVTSIAGGGMIEGVLSDDTYLIKLSSDSDSLWIGFVLEMINSISVLGIAVMMFPILKKFNEKYAIGYIAVRVIEASMCILASILVFPLLSLGNGYSLANGADDNVFNIVGKVLVDSRGEIANIMIPIFFGLGALILYYSIYKANLLPKFISIWGFVAAVLVLVNIIGFSTTLSMILVFPIILNEVFLGFWLIIKGFNYEK